ncbi:MAG: EamA/RhaT family transporter [Roseiarcus sp.]|jgi:drug/metabolite transporter (DMT)-like permease
MFASGLWAVFTLIASAAQTLRNAMQRELIGALGAVGAAQVRFLFGLPFAVLFLAGVRVSTGIALPALSPSTLAWTVLGALAQIAATALMLAAMRQRSFVVVVAFTKTEAAQVALFALIFLGETPTAKLVGAIALATAGVFLMSASGADEALPSGRPAAMGLAAAAFFAVAAIAFRAGVTTVATPSIAIAASTILVVGLAIQTAVLLAYMAAFDRAGLAAIFALWRASLFAGFMGALASQFWFLAFALTDAARVRTLALIEVPFAQVASLRLFREAPTLSEWLGMALIVAAAAVLING